MKFVTLQDKKKETILNVYFYCILMATLLFLITVMLNTLRFMGEH